MTDNDASWNDELMDSEEGNDHAVEFHLGEEEEDGDEEVYGCKSKKINPSKYEGTNVEQVVRSCSHLSLDKQNDLQEVLNKCPKLFDAELGVLYTQKRRSIWISILMWNRIRLDRTLSPGITKKCSRPNWTG